tara:strand:+ start:63997 stop:65658 length:1662 start_codon:yes stop_codon:yes gene_type:complete
VNKEFLVEVVNASLLINNEYILKNISFYIGKEEIVGIVGESGSGKSLTALSLIGLLPENSKLKAKNFIFNYQDLRGLSTKDWKSIRRSKIGMVFQEPQSSLNPSLTCEKQLLEAVKNDKKIDSTKKKELVKKVLNEVQLFDDKRIAKSYPHELSGGQKQRVMIAMALLCNPKLLIADEPTTALDVTVQKEIIQLLKSLQVKYKMSILFISHDLSLVKKLADRVLVMNNGKIVESGDTNKIFRNPNHNYTKGLVFARPDNKIRLERLPTVLDYQSNNFKPKIITSSKRKIFHKKLYSQKPLLKVKKIRKNYIKEKWFGKPSIFEALKPISFSLYPGETLGIVGESGSGKSTLAKTLVFLDPPDSGELMWLGKVINPRNKLQVNSLRKKIQFIFQDPFAALHPFKTVGSTLDEVLWVHESKNKKKNNYRVEKLLEQVGLSFKYVNRYPHELSGGQRQRIVIARALAVKPEVLICDESVAALDISVQAQILNLLNDLKSNLKLSFLFISHDLAVVKYMSDRVMVMKDGKLIEIQESDALYESPNKKYTQKLVDSIL